MMGTIKKINEKATKTAFDKKVLSAIPHLFPYVKRRLHMAESTGIIPKNMYSSNGIVDESVAKFYENGYNIDSETGDIKLKLFKFADKDLDTLFKKESFHKKTISTNAILEEELDDLKEPYTVDGDLDFILHEELSDISYQQDKKNKQIFLYDDNDMAVLNAFEAKDLAPDTSKKLLDNLYGRLPLEVSNVVDMYVFGKLSIEEISKIKAMETTRIEYIFNEVKKAFRKHID